MKTLKITTYLDALKLHDLTPTLNEEILEKYRITILEPMILVCHLAYLGHETYDSKICFEIDTFLNALPKSECRRTSKIGKNAGTYVLLINK